MKLVQDRPLAGLLAAALIIPALAATALAWQSFRDTLRYTEIRAIDTVSALSEHALKVLETNALTMEQTVRLVEGLTWDEIRQSRAVHDELHRLAADLKQVQSIWLVDPEGRIGASSAIFPPPSASVADREHFQLLKQGHRGLYVTETFSGRTSGVRTFSLAMRREAPDGTFDGMLTAAVDIDYFADFWATAMPQVVHSIVLLRGDGSLLAYHHEATDHALGAEFGPAFLASLHQGPERGVIRSGGMGHIYAWRRLEPFDMFLVAGVDPYQVAAAWAAGMALPGLFALLAVAAIFLTTWFAVRRARSERALIRQMQSAMIEREQVEAHLRKTQRLEAVGQLTGGIAHDFNNLLQVIVGCAGMARRAPDSLPNWLDSIERAAFRGQSLTNHLLSFSRRQMVRPQVLDLGTRLEEVSEMISRSLRSDIEMNVEVAGDIWPVEVDPAELELALLNLAINARDAMPDGGFLRISAENRTLEGSARNSLPEGMAGGFVAITVQDSGSGMPADVAARAFEPFFTTKEVGRGSGLGLSQVYGFAKQAGGSVVIDSTPGAGTSVTLYLPRSAGQAEAERTVGEARTLPAGLRVLLVEDTPEVAAATGKMLEQLGFLVHTVERAQDALAGIQAGSFAPDLVISDVVMPGGLSGRDLARRLAQDRPDLPVMLVSGYSSVLGQDERHLVLLTKPFTIQQLSEAVIRATERPAAVQ